MYGSHREGGDGLVRCTKGLKGTKGAGAPILVFSLTFAYPAVSWVVETGVSEGTITYGPGSCVVGEDILPGEYAVFTEDTSEQNAYSTCTITLYKDDADGRRIGTFQFQHHGLITLYKGQHLVIIKGCAVEADQAGTTLGTIGMYKAGWDMEPGIYRTTPFTFGSRCYALYNDVRYYYDHIDEYTALFEPVTVNITEGQYLELFDTGSIERVSDRMRPVKVTKK